MFQRAKIVVKLKIIRIIKFENFENLKNTWNINVEKMIASKFKQ